MSLTYQKTLVHLLALLPALWLAWQGWLLYDFQDHELTANPIQYINQYTGDWAIRLILLALALTPIRKMTGWNNLVKFRRMIGLYAFFYVVLHVMNFVILDHFFDWQTILKDVFKRPAITFGMIGALMLLPLAVTSTRGWMIRLGKGWVKLHRMIYVIGILGIIHNIMMVKADLFEPMLHLIILVILLGYRAVDKIGKKKAVFT